MIFLSLPFSSSSLPFSFFCFLSLPPSPPPARWHARSSWRSSARYCFCLPRRRRRRHQRLRLRWSPPLDRYLPPSWEVGADADLLPCHRLRPPPTTRHRVAAAGDGAGDWGARETGTTRAKPRTNSTMRTSLQLHSLIILLPVKEGAVASCYWRGPCKQPIIPPIVRSRSR